MPRRHRLPVEWLFTDPRMGDRLWAALAQLPRGGGIVFRHYGEPGREAIAHRVAAIARQRGQMLVVAGDAKLAKRVGAAGTHLPSTGRAPRGAISAAAHSQSDIVRARRAGAAIVFVSPVFATASHSGREGLGAVRFGLMAHGARIAVAALGGMNRHRFQALRGVGAAGWGAIDAWLPENVAERG